MGNFFVFQRFRSCGLETLGCLILRWLCIQFSATGDIWSNFQKHTHTHTKEKSFWDISYSFLQQGTFLNSSFEAVSRDSSSKLETNHVSKLFEMFHHIVGLLYIFTAAHLLSLLHNLVQQLHCLCWHSLLCNPINIPHSPPILNPQIELHSLNTPIIVFPTQSWARTSDEDAELMLQHKHRSSTVEKQSTQNCLPISAFGFCFTSWEITEVKCQIKTDPHFQRHLDFFATAANIYNLEKFFFSSSSFWCTKFIQFPAIHMNSRDNI